MNKKLMYQLLIFQALNFALTFFLVNTISFFFVESKTLSLGRCFLTTIIALIIFSITSFLFFYKRLKPLNNLVETLKYFSTKNANLSSRINISSDNEFEEIANYYNAFLNNIEKLIFTINNTSSNVAESSISLTHNIQEIIHGNGHDEKNIAKLKLKTEEVLNHVSIQTASSEEVASTLTEVAENISSIAKNATHTLKIFDKTKEEAYEGGLSVAENLKEIMDLEITVKDIESKSINLGKSSEKIGEIVIMINKISQQTNLLSLNAAIEANRAGEAGRGFAVVAEEIRVLADSSKSATQEIEKLISIIKTEIDGVIESIAIGYDKAKKGRNLSEGTKVKIENIIRQIEDTSLEVSGISTSINEQAVAVDDLNSATVEIADKSIAINGLANDQYNTFNDIVQAMNTINSFSGELSESAKSLNEVAQYYTKNIPEEYILFKWIDSLSVGIPQVDREHKILVKLINQLNAAIIENKNRPILSAILDALLDYTAIHFKHEEQIMEKFGYPTLDEHKQIHIGFVNKIKDVINDFETGKNIVSSDLLEFLKEWLFDHIMGTDQLYSSFFQKNNIKF